MTFSHQSRWSPTPQSAPGLSSSFPECSWKPESQTKTELQPSTIQGAPPLQTRPAPTSESRVEEDLEEAIQPKERGSATGDPSESGAGSTPPPETPLQRADRLGHYFSQVSVGADQESPVQAYSMAGWIQRACAECQQEQERQELGIQAQLTLGQPGDRYEVEADQVAAQVMSMPKPYPQEQQGLQASPMLQRIPQVQRSAQAAANSEFESRLSSAEGRGSLLPGSVQRFMGPRLGADLSSVRVHTDAESVQMNQELGAQAFTHQNHVYYGAGKGPANDHLTAHELTHMIQQGGGRPLSRKQIQRQLADYLNAQSPSEALLQPKEAPSSEPQPDLLQVPQIQAQSTDGSIPVLDVGIGTTIGGPPSSPSPAPIPFTRSPFLPTQGPFPNDDLPTLGISVEQLEELLATLEPDQIQAEPGPLTGEQAAQWDFEVLFLGDRLTRTFENAEQAMTYARSLGQAAAVLQEDQLFVVYFLSNKIPFTAGSVQGEQADQTTVAEPSAEVRALITVDGFVLRPEGNGFVFFTPTASGDPFALHQQVFGSVKALTDEPQPTGLGRLSEDRERFLAQFERAMQDVALTRLELSAQVALEQQQTYDPQLLPPDSDVSLDERIAQEQAQVQQQQEQTAGELASVEEVQALLDAYERLQRLEALAQELETATQVATELAALDAEIAPLQQRLNTLDGTGADGSGGPVAGLSPSVAAAREAVTAELQAKLTQRQGILARYPMLGRLDPQTFAQQSQQQQLADLSAETTQVLADIATTQINLQAGKLNLWLIPDVVQATLEGLQLTDQGQAWVSERTQAEQVADALTEAAIAVLQIGVGVAAVKFPVLLPVAVGGSALEALRVTDQFEVERAASNTDLDPSQSLLPEELATEYGWVIVAWLGVGLEFADAIRAVRGLQAGRALDEVLQEAVEASDGRVTREALRGAYEGGAEGVVMTEGVARQILKESMDADTLAQYGEDLEGVTVTVLEAQAFRDQYGAVGEAVTLIRPGEGGQLRAEVVISQGADPLVLQQEVPHLRQIANSELSDELSQLSEANLSNWSQKPVAEQLEIARLQLELEIDAQKQLLIQYGWDPKLNETLARLNARLDEVQSAIETGVRPSWLDPDRPPRLYNQDLDLLTQIYDQLGAEPPRLNVRVNDAQYAVNGAHTIERHGPDVPLRRADAPGQRTIEGRIYGDPPWPRAENNSYRWIDESTMNQVVNDHIRSNWDSIRSDLALDKVHRVTFDAGRLVGEGFYNVNQAGLGPSTAVYGQTSHVRIIIRLIPGNPPSFYIETTFPAGRGF